MENSDIRIYQLEDGKTEINVQLDNETVWLNLNQMVALFERDKSVISRHISNVLKENELHKDSVVAKNATTASDGKRLHTPLLPKGVSPPESAGRLHL
jgi:hypothetical protein